MNLIKRVKDQTIGWVEKCSSLGHISSFLMTALGFMYEHMRPGKYPIFWSDEAWSQGPRTQTFATCLQKKTADTGKPRMRVSAKLSGP